jgi:hypothetical protein
LLRSYAGVEVRRHRYSWRTVRRCPLRPASADLIYRRGGLPWCAHTAAEAGAGSKTSAGAPGRGRARTDRWVLRCAAVDERGSPTWRTGLRGRPGEGAASSGTRARTLRQWRRAARARALGSNVSVCLGLTAFF